LKYCNFLDIDVSVCLTVVDGLVNIRSEKWEADRAEGDGEGPPERPGHRPDPQKRPDNQKSFTGKREDSKK
jgi:hypothetical protein